MLVMLDLVVSVVAVDVGNDDDKQKEVEIVPPPALPTTSSAARQMFVLLSRRILFLMVTYAKAIQWAPNPTYIHTDAEASWKAYILYRTI
jgi:hypothetical protein